MDLGQQRAKLQQHLSGKKNLLAARSFVSLFAWKDFFDYDCEDIDGCLCVFARQSAGSFMCMPPLGDGLTAATVQKCFERMAVVNRGGSLSRIENVSAQELSLFDLDRYTVKLRSHDYYYFREDLVRLSGLALKSKRHDLNLFEKHYRDDFRPFSDDDAQECLDLYGRWAKDRSVKYDDEMYRMMLEDSRRMHECLMRHHKELGLTGRVMVIENRIEGYTFGFPLTNDCFVVVLEVVNLALKGAAVKIFHNLCCDTAVREYKFINTMDDSGLKNIKRAKMSFQPSFLVPSYVVTKKEQ